MSSKLFVGGLSPNTDDATLRAAFEPFGELTEARVILDRDTGRSRGFGFVRYTTPDMARGALEKMGGAMLDGRSIRVDLAEDRPGPGGPRPGPPRDGGGGRFGDGGGRFGDRPPGGGRFGDGGPGGGRFGDGGGRFGDRPPGGGRFGDGGPGGGRFGDRPPGPGGGRFGDGGPGGGRFGDRPPGAGFRPRGPGGPGGGPGGPGRFGPGGGGPGGGAPAADESGWDDARMPRRTEPAKKKATEGEGDRRPAKVQQKEKRVSGKSWRQWDDDDDMGED